jgi:dTDP-4-amino-4,6-dideoxygalactose transaminase
MPKEIGSEFWEYTPEIAIHKLPDWLNWGCDNRLFVSGRTALDHIILDIKATQLFRVVYMPSYCCHTMIEPFVSNGIKVLFYDVVVNENGALVFNMDYNVICDALMIMNYFGFLSTDIESIIDRFKKNKEVIIIEDSTHSLFCKKAINSNSDYVFASFRKWFAIPGGAMASKINSEFNIPVQAKIHDIYVKLKVESMRLKEEYLSSFKSEKELFLELFRQSEELIDKDYKGYTIDKLSYSILESLDVNDLREKRFNNALLLTNSLNKHSDLKPLFRILKTDDCPLFVPVICRRGKRDNLKQFLIQNNIYCPVHWPKSDLLLTNYKSDLIYDRELSLVCDQRYDTFDMERIITTVDRFYSNL